MCAEMCERICLGMGVDMSAEMCSDDYIGHNCIGHNCMGHNYITCSTASGADVSIVLVTMASLYAFSLLGLS